MELLERSCMPNCISRDPPRATSDGHCGISSKKILHFINCSCNFKRKENHAPADRGMMTTRTFACSLLVRCTYNEFSILCLFYQAYQWRRRRWSGYILKCVVIDSIIMVIIVDSNPLLTLTTAKSVAEFKY